MKMPNPVNRPERVGTIHGILSPSNPVQPNQKSPPAKRTPPTTEIGRRHSGTGMLLFASSLRA